MVIGIIIGLIIGVLLTGGAFILISKKIINERVKRIEIDVNKSADETLFKERRVMNEQFILGQLVNNEEVVTGINENGKVTLLDEEENPIKLNYSSIPINKNESRDNGVVYSYRDVFGRDDIAINVIDEQSIHDKSDDIVKLDNSYRIGNDGLIGLEYSMFSSYINVKLSGVLKIGDSYLEASKIKGVRVLSTSDASNISDKFVDRRVISSNSMGDSCVMFRDSLPTNLHTGFTVVLLTDDYKLYYLKSSSVQVDTSDKNITIENISH